MAKFYSRQTIGVLDGTNPPKKSHADQVHAKKRSFIADKNPSGGTQALASADTFVLGVLPAGATISQIIGLTDTSLGTSTISIGTAAAPTKYVNAATFTATNIPTILPLLASARDAGPTTAEEILIVTVGVATIAAGTKLSLEIEYLSVG